jgi:hypothetical protein
MVYIHRYVYIKLYWLKILVRDELEAKKPEFEEKILKLLGVPWTFEVDPLTIWPYAEEGNYGYNALGACIYA